MQINITIEDLESRGMLKKVCEMKDWDINNVRAYKRHTGHISLDEKECREVGLR